MSDEEYLQQAVELSLTSPEEIGCGVVIVDKDGILAQKYNSQNTDNVAVYHAEIKALIAANVKTGTRKLKDAIAYCSCEPCAMCLTALSYAKVSRVIFNKRMIDVFPEDPQSQLDSHSFIQGLNFKPILQQINLSSSK